MRRKHQQQRVQDYNDVQQQQQPLQQNKMNPISSSTVVAATNRRFTAILCHHHRVGSKDIVAFVTYLQLFVFQWMICIFLLQQSPSSIPLLPLPPHSASTFVTGFIIKPTPVHTFSSVTFAQQKQQRSTLSFTDSSYKKWNVSFLCCVLYIILYVSFR